VLPLVDNSFFFDPCGPIDGKSSSSSFPDSPHLFVFPVLVPYDGLTFLFKLSEGRMQSLSHLFAVLSPFSGFFFAIFLCTFFTFLYSVVLEILYSGFTLLLPIFPLPGHLTRDA